MKRKNKSYILWLAIILAFALHYAISFTNKSDEALFLILALAGLAILITSWIFSKFNRRR